MRKFRFIREGSVPIIETLYEPGRVTMKLRNKLVHVYMGMYPETGWKSLIVGRPFLDPEGVEVVDVMIDKSVFWLKFKGHRQTFKVSEACDNPRGFLF